jgi:hypothetical protein
MLRALFWTAALAALTAAVLLVPIDGKPLWDRSGPAVAWVKSVAAGKPAAKKEQRPQARLKKPKPAEKLTAEDRAALDSLIVHSR